MIQETHKIQTYVTHMKCDCGGVMLPDSNISLMSYPALYSHKCDKCGKTEYFRDIYPIITYDTTNKEDV